MKRRTWKRDELLVAFNLYCKLRFGQCHGRNPSVIALAKVLGRSAGSVAMKLCNVASFDPAHRRRGVAGLGNASRGDREIWDELSTDLIARPAAAPPREISAKSGPH
jgi:putative restriction endonuclease